MSNPIPVKSKSRPSARAQHSRMEDIARNVGVSMMTVSRAINTPDKVAAKTRVAIDKAIASAGYVPNLVAGSLMSNRSRVVAAIVPTIDNSIFAQTVRGLSDTLAVEGYQLLLAQTDYDTQKEERLVSALLGRRVDGMVLTGINHSKATIKKLKAARIPVVETWELTDKPIDMVAGFSNFDAGREIARYLLAKGHRQLGFAGHGDDRAHARLAGFKAAVKRVPGARVSMLLMPRTTPFRAGREALAQMLARRPVPDAIFFTNDALAIGALMECRRRGLRVPQDIAIAGFTDLEIAAELVPALTTVQVGAGAIGEQAGRMLLERLSGAARAERIRDLGFVVVPRETA